MYIHAYSSTRRYILHKIQNVETEDTHCSPLKGACIHLVYLLFFIGTHYIDIHRRGTVRR